jgi:threonine dehydrogenase-like Zn-dependent dehydrogenase
MWPRRQGGQGKKVAVVGDGTVGLCCVIVAKRLGAEQIVIPGRHPRIYKGAAPRPP